MADGGARSADGRWQMADGESGWAGPSAQPPTPKAAISAAAICHPPSAITISALPVRLRTWMMNAMAQNERIADVVRREQSRLLQFIRRRVPGLRGAEGVLQGGFLQLVEANRAL